MPDPRAFVEGGNLGLTILVSVLALAAGIAWIGPRHFVVYEVVDEFERKLERHAEWWSESDGMQPTDETERGAWREDFASALEVGLLHADEPTLLARVAQLFAGSSVKDLQVTRFGDAEEDVPLTVLEPEGSRTLEIQRIPLEVQLQVSYGDLRRILGRIEGDRGPLRIDRIELRRDYPGIRVQARLTLFTRREVAA